MRWLRGPLSEFRRSRQGLVRVDVHGGGYWGSGCWRLSAAHSQPLAHGMERRVDVYVAAISETARAALIDGLWLPLTDASSLLTIGEEVCDPDRPRRAVRHQVRVYAQGPGTLVIPIDPLDELLQWEELLTYRGLCFVQCLLAGVGMGVLTRAGMSPEVLDPDKEGPRAQWLPERVRDLTVGHGSSPGSLWRPTMMFVFWGDESRRIVVSRDTKMAGTLTYPPVPAGEVAVPNSRGLEER